MLQNPQLFKHWGGGGVVVQSVLIGGKLDFCDVGCLGFQITSQFLLPPLETDSYFFHLPALLEICNLSHQICTV